MRYEEENHDGFQRSMFDDDDAQHDEWHDVDGGDDGLEAPPMQTAEVVVVDAVVL